MPTKRTGGATEYNITTIKSALVLPNSHVKQNSVADDISKQTNNKVSPVLFLDGVMLDHPRSATVENQIASI